MNVAVAETQNSMSALQVDPLQQKILNVSFLFFDHRQAQSLAEPFHHLFYCPVQQQSGWDNDGGCTRCLERWVVKDSTFTVFFLGLLLFSENWLWTQKVGESKHTKFSLYVQSRCRCKNEVSESELKHTDLCSAQEPLLWHLVLWPHSTQAYSGFIYLLQPPTMLCVCVGGWVCVCPVGNGTLSQQDSRLFPLHCMKVNV